MAMRNSSKRPSSSAALMRAAHCISRRRRMSSMSFSAKLCTRLRPDSLAAAQAESAAERIEATSSLSAVIGTTPMLAPRRNTRSSQVKRKLRTPSRRVSAVRIACAVAAGVVDDLELVYVEVAERVGRLACLGALQRALEAALELAPVHEP